MQILLGTTNPSKVGYFMNILKGTSVSFLTLRDLGITDEPLESGSSPRENAAIKAQFYARYMPDGAVLCADSGLYLAQFSMDDPRQPGLHIRTPNGCARLDDEAMIQHYAALAHSLGGSALAYYLDSAAIFYHGELHTFEQTQEEVQADGFYLVDTPNTARRAGWPLDSISKTLDGYDFLDTRRPIPIQQTSAYKPRLRAFILSVLHL